MNCTKWIVAASLGLTTGSANAALILSESGVAGPTAEITFDAFPTQIVTLGPVQVGAPVDRDVVFTATNSFGAAGFSAALYGFGSNGLWDSSMTSAWVNPGSFATMRFTFADGPVSAVGAFMNYCINGVGSAGCGTGGVTLRALDSSLNVLEAYRLDLVAPIVTPEPAMNAGAFRGISRTSADIYAFELSGAGAFDNLVFTNRRQSVPEPGSLGLLAIGLLGTLTMHRKRPRAA